MKKVGKITVLFQILVLYCFLVSICSTNTLAFGTPFQNERSSREDGFSKIAVVDLFTITTKTENVVVGYKNLPTFTFKNHSNDYPALRKAAESYLLNRYSKYIFFAKTLVVRLQSSAIIFPFHYFW